MARWGSTEIQTLRVRGGRSDPAIRLRLSNMLGAADFRPANLSPSAVLIVRHLEDPLPHRLSPKRNAARVDLRWERAVRSRLADLYRTAARPSRGRLPPNAEAVCFADESEMLACLALDLSRGEAAHRWWWRVPLRHLKTGSLSERLSTLLIREPAAVPAVLAHLSVWGEALPVLRSVSAAHAEAVLDAVCSRFDIDLTPPPSDWANAPGQQDVRAEPVPSSLRRPPERVLPPPWSGSLPAGAVPGAVGVSQQFLMAVGLLIYHRPGLVRQAEFRRVLVEWRERGLSPTSEDGPEVERPGVPVHKPRGGVAAAARTEEQPTRRIAAVPAQNDAPTASKVAQPGEIITPPRRIRTTVEQSPRLTEPFSAPGAAAVHPQEKARIPIVGDEEVARSAVSSFEIMQTGPTVTPDDPVEPVPVIPPKEHQEASFLEESPIQERPHLHNGPGGIDLENGEATRLGGVLYLINLMTYLNLPECFEESWSLDSEVGPWGLLEILGRCLLDPATDDLIDDPLWHALALLDGREAGTMPAPTFRGSDRFILPAAWREDGGSIVEGPYYRAARGGVLRVWSEGGIVVAELPQDDQALVTQFNGHRRAFHSAPLAEIAGPFVSGLNPALVRWASLAIPYLSCRLEAALGVEPARSLLLQDARLYITSSHVDLVIPLESISLPIRRAGLDRDPGWLPRLGRVVYFHFE